MLKTLHMLVPYTRVDVILRFAAASVWNATRGLVCRESTNVEMRIWSLIKKHAAECYDMVRVRYGFWWYGLGTGYDKQNPYHKTRCTHRILPWRTKRSYHSFERIIEYVTCPLDKALKLRGRICSSSQCCCSAAHGSPAMNPFCSVSVLFEQHLCGHASRPVPCDHGIFRMSFKFCLPSHTFSASFPHCLCSSILLGSTGGRSQFWDNTARLRPSAHLSDLLSFGAVDWVYASHELDILMICFDVRVSDCLPSSTKTRRTIDFYTLGFFDAKVRATTFRAS